MRFLSSLLVSAVVSLTLATGARAQQVSTAEPSPAREAFEEGRNHFEDERYLLAAEAFQRAYDLMREAGMPNAWLILYNLGTSLDEIRGREREARDAYARYLEHAPTTDAESAQRVALVQSRIRELDLRIAAASSDRAEPPEPVAPRPNIAPGEAETTMSPIGPIVLGAGGALLVAGAVVAAILAVENDSFLAMCDDGTCPSSARASAESVQDLAIAADVLLIGGAVVAATGLALTLLLRDGVDQPPPVSAACGSTGCSVHLRLEL